MEHNKANEALEQLEKEFGGSFFIFKKSVCDIMKLLPDEEQLKLFWMVANYQLSGKEPESKIGTDKAGAVFFLMKDNLSSAIEMKDVIVKSFVGALANHDL